MCEPSINPLPQWRPPEHGRRYRSFFGEACPYLAVLGSLSIRVIMAWLYLKYLRGATVLLLVDPIKRHPGSMPISQAVHIQIPSSIIVSSLPVSKQSLLSLIVTCQIRPILSLIPSYRSGRAFHFPPIYPLISTAGSDF